MQISCTFFAACMLFMVWQGQAQNVPMDYRYKMRHPPQLPPRLPPNPQYMRKKMEQLYNPPRHLNKPRPIPMHFAPEFNAPPLGPPAPKIHYRPTPAPHRQWKNPKIQFPSSTEKPFQSSQAIGNTHEFDYHVQTNNIPTNSIPIKQVGEKGPIHTIPAPNLSLADKPIVVEEVRQEIKLKSHRPPSQHQQSFLQQTFAQPQFDYPQSQQQQQQFVQPPPTYTQSQPSFTHQKIHQYAQNQPSASNQLYQVTEGNELIPNSAEKLVRTQQIFFQPEGNNQNYEKLQNPQFGKAPEPQSYKPPSNDFGNGELSSDALYELLKPHFDQKPNLFVAQKSSDIPISFSEFKDASEVMFKATEQQQKFAQPNFNQANQVFAYERHAPQNLQSDNNESEFLTANYNFKADFPSNSVPQAQEQQNSPYIQEVFNQQSNYGNGNVIELNGKNQFNNNNLQEETVNGAFYTTLENQQAGETLASLQALDQANNLFNNKNIDNQTPLEIYVADDQFNEQGNGQSLQYNDEGKTTQEIREQEQTNEPKNEQVSATTKRSNFRGRHGSFASRTKPKPN